MDEKIPKMPKLQVWRMGFRTENMEKSIYTYEDDRLEMKEDFLESILKFS